MDLIAVPNDPDAVLTAGQRIRAEGVARRRNATKDARDEVTDLNDPFEPTGAEPSAFDWEALAKAKQETLARCAPTCAPHLHQHCSPDCEAYCRPCNRAGGL